MGWVYFWNFSPSTAIGSSQTGLWTNNTTWQGGSLPTISDQVTINQGHIVTIPIGQTVTAGTLFNKGILQGFGTLQMGTLVPNTSTSSGTLQTIDYKYNIRNFLSGINLDASGNLTNKLFSMKLSFENSGYYDGNIGKQEWKSGLDGLTRSFTYSYDKSNRILGGSYMGNGSENYSLNSVSYDLNGNIKTLSRNGLKSNNTFGVIDNLNYTYQANSNKIQAVADISGETASFTDATGTTDYTYSADGSLISDANKGITLIEYNYLKLPKRIVKGGTTILYQYDASGRKLKETIGANVTDYVGNLIYKNNVLYQIGHDEGRIANGIYEYGINDHLGNMRVMFRDSSGIAKPTQVENFGVWGESLTGINYYRNTTNKQNFVYTGHEKLEELGVFDAKARVYDPITPRFWQQDILADKFRPISPYAISLNNPLRFIDPSGMEVISVAGGVKFTGDDARDAYSIIIGRKKNVVIDISAKSGYSDADRRVNYDHWATFTVSNMTLANEMLAVFKEGAIKNLVIGSHGLNVFSDNRHLKKTGFKFKSDDARNERFTFKDVKTYNENGSVDGSAGEDIGIRMLQSIMTKVATGGNCIFAVCYLGQSDNNIDIEFAKELSTLSGNRLNLYTYSDFTSIWRYLDGDNIGATSIGGDARLESKLASPSAYWNKIQNGSILERLKKIILSDSPNPVEFKK